MKRILALILLIAVALAGYVVSGPYLAIQGIRAALAEQNTRKLERHVDFPALRVNLRAQLQDQLARRAGVETQSSLLGSIALALAGNAVGAGVDTMVTPLGIGAILQGRSVWKKARGQTVGGDSYAPAVPYDPMREAQHRYESSSRFTATILDEDGDPVVFVFSRQGLRWRLTDIRLPL